MLEFRRLSGAHVADVRGQRAGVGEPVPRAAAVLRGAGAHVPGAPALRAAAAPVSTTCLLCLYIYSLC